MAEFVVRNNLNPNKAIKCTITFRPLVNKYEEGEATWVLEIATLEPHKDGGAIKPVFVHYTQADNLDKAVGEAVAKISDQVDWSPLNTDSRPPYVTYHLPAESVAKITSSVNVGIKDMGPSSGIDKSTIRMIINGFDVTDSLAITGDPFLYNVAWTPPLRIYDYE